MTPDNGGKSTAGEDAPRSDTGKREFREKVGLLVLDKVIFGLLIVGAAFLLNTILDRNRAETAFQNEIAKVRVSKVAAASAVLDAQQAVTDRIARLTFKGGLCRNGRYDPTTFETLLVEFARGRARLDRLLQTNRFWFGDELFAEMRAYGNGQRRMNAQLRGFQRQRVQLVQITVANLENIVSEQHGGLPPAPPRRNGYRIDLKRLNRLLADRTLVTGELARSTRTVLCGREGTAATGLINKALTDLQAQRQDIEAVMAKLAA